MSIKTRAAVVFQSPGQWETVTLDLDEPKTGEVLVQMAASGLCHSMDHLTTGDTPAVKRPVVGGDEGSGIVRAVGPGVTEVAVGDHVVTSFIPACGTCRWCASGQQHICDNGAKTYLGTMLDGTFRMHFNGQDVTSAVCVGSFSEWQVLDVRSLVKVPKDLPLDVLALLGCGVPTGWGSATNAANIAVGDVAIVMGCGGIGINAVQGASHAGASHVVAVDPQPYKREMALKVGATEAFTDIADTTDFVKSVTNGQGADAAIVTTGVRKGEHIAQAFSAIRKAGTVVVTALGHWQEMSIPVNLMELTLYQKRIQGCLYGNAGSHLQVPKLINLYRTGQLKLDELISNRYSIDQVNEGYADMHAGKNIRGLIDFRIL